MARLRFARFASSGLSPNFEAFIEKVINWNESPGCNRLSPRSTAALACAMGRPSMLPEQSITNTISIGCRGNDVSSFGG
jgi:hypothetical protein